MKWNDFSEKTVKGWGTMCHHRQRCIVPVFVQVIWMVFSKRFWTMVKISQIWVM